MRTFYGRFFFSGTGSCGTAGGTDGTRSVCTTTLVLVMCAVSLSFVERLFMVSVSRIVDRVWLPSGSEISGFCVSAC